MESVFLSFKNTCILCAMVLIFFAVTTVNETSIDERGPETEYVVEDMGKFFYCETWFSNMKSITLVRYSLARSQHHSET